MTTADQVLAALHAHHLADEGGGKYRCDSPLRPGSNSHAFCLKIDGPEHGTWYDQVSGEKGSLYELAAQLGIATPTAASAAATTTSTTKRGYAGLSDYAQAHGIPAAVYAAWGWHETTHKGRPALEFPTANGPRWRLLDGGDPPFDSPYRYRPCWYGLAEAVILASASNQPLVLCNGEASVVAAQHAGVAACCITNSGERVLPAPLLQELRAAWTDAILVALDCDSKGHTAAPKLAAQVGGQVVDLGGTNGFDLADFCQLHGAGAIAELRRRAQSPPASTTPAPAPVPTTVSARILAALTDLGYSFRLNLLADDIEVNGASITDVTRAQIRTALRDRDVRPLGAVEDVYTVEAAAHAYHPIREYLDGLVWDGQEHIAALCGYLQSSDPPVAYSTGDAPLHSVYLYRWLIGAVAKVFDQKQNLMLVLVGAQGLGKSELPRWLCHKLSGYHLEAPIAVGDKDTDIRLMTKWIWEVSELDATTRKADVAALKDFITRADVTVRKPYGHHDVVKPAIASLIGTVNDGEGFLADPTGNRRFLVTTITAIDWSYTQLDIDQIWAEAVVRYRRGESWRLLPNELTAQTETNRNHEIGDPIEGWLEKYFWFDPTQDVVGMTTSDIIDHLRSKDVPINADRGWETRIGAALRRRGLSKAQSRTSGRVRRYMGVIPR